MESFYRALVCNGKVSPSDFWEMDIEEAYWFINHLQEQETIKKTGMTNAQLERLYQMCP